MDTDRAQETLDALRATDSVGALVRELTRGLPGVTGTSACLVSRVIGDLLIEIAGHSDEGWSPGGHPYLASDYPVTLEALQTGEPRLVCLEDPAPDPAEAALLRTLGYDSVLILPLASGGAVWGLVELYAHGRVSPRAAADAAALLAELGPLVEERELAGARLPGR